MGLHSKIEIGWKNGRIADGCGRFFKFFPGQEKKTL
jgi:hypothetical protein